MATPEEINGWWISAAAVARPRWSLRVPSVPPAAWWGSQKNIGDEMREERRAGCTATKRGVELRSTAQAVRSSPTSIMPK